MEGTNLLQSLLNNTNLALTLVQSIPFPLFVKNTKGEYIYVNDALLTATNTSLKDFIFRTSPPLTTEYKTWTHNDLDLFSSGQIKDKEYTFGEDTYRVIKFPFRSPLGEKYLVGFAVKKENSDKYLSDVFERLADNLEDGVVVMKNSPEEDYPVVFVNNKFELITGYSPEETIGTNCRFLQGKDTSMVTVKLLRSAITGGQPFNGVILNYKKDGTPFWNSLKLSPVYDGTSRQITHFVSIQKDITQETVAGKQALEDAEKKYDDLPALVFSLNDEGEIVSTNDYIITYLDCEVEEALGEKFTYFLDNKSTENFEKNLFPSFRATGLLSTEVVKTKNDRLLVLSAKQTLQGANVFIAYEAVSSPKLFVPPDSGPWYVQWGYAVLSYLPRKLSYMLLAALLLVSGYGGGLYTYHKFYNKFKPTKEVTLSDSWDFLALISPQEYTLERKQKISEVLENLRNKHQSVRGLVRFYVGSDGEAQLGLDLYRPGPTRGPIPRGLWYINMKDSGYVEVTESFRETNCHVRDRSDLNTESQLYLSLLKLGIAQIVSCPDKYNSYFYTSLDFEVKLTPEQLEAVQADIKEANIQIWEIMGY